MSDDLRDLHRYLGTGAFGHVHEHHPEIASTNDRALEWARAGAPHGALVSADLQLAGRGRRGRAWSSAPGEGLTFSVIVRPGALGLAEGFGALALAVGVGLREALAPHLPGLALKWPNDLLHGGKKLAGILCEGRWQAGRAEVLVIGVGVNVRQRALQPELEGRATSLALAGAPPLGRAPLLAALLASIEAALGDFARGGFAAIRPRYEPHSALHGREVMVDEPGGTQLRARAEALDDDGALLIRPLAGGPRRRVEAADVWLAPPT